MNLCYVLWTYKMNKIYFKTTITTLSQYVGVSLFDCFGVFVPLKNFLTHIETSLLPVNGCKCRSMLGTHDHWAGRFFSVPHLLWHGTSIYNGNLRGPVTLTPIAEHLAVELSLPVFTTYVCCSWNLNTQPSVCEAM